MKEASTGSLRPAETMDTAAEPPTNVRKVVIPSITMRAQVLGERDQADPDAIAPAVAP